MLSFSIDSKRNRKSDIPILVIARTPSDALYFNQKIHQCSDSSNNISPFSESSFDTLLITSSNDSGLSDFNNEDDQNLSNIYMESLSQFQYSELNNNSKQKGLAKFEEDMLIRMSIGEEQLASLSPSDFNNLCRDLNHNQSFILKDIRRRSKNKIAARECRKRRLNIQDELEKTLKIYEEKYVTLKLRLDTLKTLFLPD
ncbi:hypothetical protein HZS_582 [Henneguya salminicola]|nr:hypothetical protein HZS_582 [Henneguya salminicola]